jgi:hypothetical protein
MDFKYNKIFLRVELKPGSDKTEHKNDTFHPSSKDVKMVFEK